MTAQDIIDLAIQVREAVDDYEAASLLTKVISQAKLDAVAEFSEQLRKEWMRKD